MRFLPACALSAALCANAAAVTAQFPPPEVTFAATYYKILENEDYFGANLDLTVHMLRMSDDGGTVAFWGCGGGGCAIYFCEFPCTTVRDVPVPANPDNAAQLLSFSDMAISDDGARLFLHTVASMHRIYKVESDVFTEILDLNDAPWGAQIAVDDSLIRTTGAGDWVYFAEDRDDLWRVAHNGGAPTVVVEDTSVLRGGNPGWAVDWFDVSDDGATIAFTLLGAGGVLTQTDLFAKTSSGLHQLTDSPAAEGHPVVSASGLRIAARDGNWFSILPNGSGRVDMVQSGSNVAGSSITGDGSWLFYNDNTFNALDPNGGRLARTDGSARIQVFPYNTMAVVADPEISEDGTRVAFLGSPFSSRDPYVGVLDSVSPLASAPMITSVAFDPAFIPAVDPMPSVLVTPTDPQGLSDILGTFAETYTHGEYEGDSSDVPVLVNFDPNDDGARRDEVAGDGIFTSGTRRAAGFGVVPGVTIRTAVKDARGSWDLVDVLLLDCPDIGCWVFQDGFESGNTNRWSNAVGTTP